MLSLLDRRIRGIDRAITELRQLHRALAGTRSSAARHKAEDTDSMSGIIEHAAWGFSQG